MKLSEEKKWLEIQNLYTKTDPERGPEILKFTETLAEFTEAHLDTLGDEETTPTNVRAVLEAGFREINPKHLFAPELVESLVILTQVWSHGQILWDSFTYLDRQFVGENLAHKIQMASEEATQK